MVTDRHGDARGSHASLLSSALPRALLLAATPTDQQQPLCHHQTPRGGDYVKGQLARASPWLNFLLVARCVGGSEGLPRVSRPSSSALGLSPPRFLPQLCKV